MLCPVMDSTGGDALFGLRPWITGRRGCCQLTTCIRWQGPCCQLTTTCPGLWNLARVWLAFPPSPIVDKFARSSISATVSYFIRRPRRLASGTTVSHAGLLGPALLMDRTEAIDGELGLPVGCSFPMTRGYRSISTPAWCLPKVSSHGGLACLTLTSHSVAWADRT